MKTASKQQALNLFEVHRTEFLEECRRVARELAHENGTVSVDDLREQIELPENLDGRVYGAVFNSNEWVKVGYKPTSRPSSHGRLIAIFELK